MDDFLTYFLAGMLGEEFMRKIATRPYGFLYLWLIGFILTYIFFFMLLSFFIVLGVFTDPVADSGILNYVFSSYSLATVKLHPQATYLALVMGLFFAGSYRLHYRLKMREGKGKRNK